MIPFAATKSSALRVALVMPEAAQNGRPNTEKVKTTDVSAHLNSLLKRVALLLSASTNFFQTFT